MTAHDPDHHEEVSKMEVMAGGKAWRYATWTIGALLLITVVITFWQQVTLVAERQTRTLADLMGHIETAGLDVGKAEPLPIDEALRDEVEEALLVTVSGHAVQIYRFPERMLLKSGELAPQHVAQILKLPTGTEPAMNGVYVMTGHQAHPQRDALVASFTGFGTPLQKAP